MAREKREGVAVDIIDHSGKVFDRVAVTHPEWMRALAHSIRETTDYFGGSSASGARVISDGPSNNPHGRYISLYGRSLYDYGKVRVVTLKQLEDYAKKHPPFNFYAISVSTRLSFVVLASSHDDAQQAASERIGMEFTEHQEQNFSVLGVSRAG